MFDPKKYWDDRLNQHYDLIGVGDISLGMNYNKWSYNITRKILRRLFIRHSVLPKNDNVLDIGCGTGFVVEIWQSLGKKLTGIDISTTAINRLQEKFPEFSFMEFDIGSGRLDLPDNKFGICSAASVLYHIIDDNSLDRALGNIHRVLQPNGIFIFSDNFNHNSEYSITHQKCRTLFEYEKALLKNGFEIVERVPNYVLMNDPVDAKTKFYPRLWNLFTRLSKKSKLMDAIIWPALYPVELLLTSVMKESPAQEFMICKAIK
ncbi:MAG TPA: class I SAM-dependent methyltransferase [Ferruginibacter sp.]|jgi:ubiquinone/menaquinone biosynthesis C-methylase UbiE|nr:class I SAM-dependent methyltransferase [Ferruginibacter sp.]